MPPKDKTLVDTRSPLTMSMEGEPSSVDPEFKGNLIKPVPKKYPFVVRGTSSRAFEALKKDPLNGGGSVVKLSDHSSLCISSRGTEVAVGSADQAVYIVNVEKGKFVRCLLSKTCGHVEWVTCVEFMNDGRVLSGGMDSKLCLWDKNIVKCINLIGHHSAISSCKTIDDGSLGISCSYDKTIRIWDLMNSGKNGHVCLGTLKGHKGAITHMTLSAQQTNILSVSKVGEVILWDGQEGRSIVHCVDAHDGSVMAVKSMVGGNKPEREEAGTGEMFLTGGQDGILHVWDFRVQPGPLNSVGVHRSYNGCPVSFIGVSHSTSGYALVVTAGGDKTLKVLEPRKSFKTIHTIHDHTENISCLQVYGGLAWSGGADGKVLLHQVNNGECLYTVQGSTKGAVKCMCLAEDNKLVTSGDDGTVHIFTH